MRLPHHHENDRDRLEVKMTPMIDVIFLLLIFFVCTASFQQPEEILPTNMSLPGSLGETAEVDPLQEDLDQIVVEILWRDGFAHWRINRRDYARLDEVAAVLSAAAGVQADLPVILDVEAAVPIENVIDVCDLCRRIGLEKVQFAALVEDS